MPVDPDQPPASLWRRVRLLDPFGPAVSPTLGVVLLLSYSVAIAVTFVAACFALGRVVNSIPHGPQVLLAILIVTPFVIILRYGIERKP